MPAIGLIVEGEYDEAVIPELLKRCRSGVNVVTRKCRGSVLGRLAAIVQELSRSRTLERVLIVADADGRPPEEVIKAIRDRLTPINRLSVIPLVIVQMLEAWLIADSNTLKNVLGISGAFANPERVRDPKSELRRWLGSKAYTPRLARTIAAQIDLNVLAHKCPRFDEFQRALRR